MSCWVIVEAPCTGWPACQSAWAARTIACQSTPRCLKNRWSSAATTARRMVSGMSCAETVTWLSAPLNWPMGVPSRA